MAGLDSWGSGNPYRDLYDYPWPHLVQVKEEGS